MDAITDSAGEVVERQSFDAWGRKRSVTYSGGNWIVTYPSAPSAETHRGFTGHEMLDLVNLVHMGGRVYDPITARFLSPDPFVQSPDNLQNLNRYSYVLNNPLSYTDPSGFFFKSIGKWIKNNWKQVVAIGVGIAISFIVPGSWTIFAQAFASGFGSAFSGTLLAGGSVGEALRAGLRGGAINGATASALGGLSYKYGWSGKDFSRYAKASGSEFAEKLAEKTIAHGFVGGTSEVIGGGKFTHGFMSSAASAAASPIIYAQTHNISDVLGVAAAATVAGTVSQFGGGKFANGAISGATGYLFNTLGNASDQPQDSIPSADPTKCADFWNSSSIIRKVTEAFRMNAIDACTYGGDDPMMGKIRLFLQQTYLAVQPSNGNLFSATEHQIIHDRAYVAAGCAGTSARWLGWYAVDNVDFSKSIIKASIDNFGNCQNPNSVPLIGNSR